MDNFLIIDKIWVVPGTLVKEFTTELVTLSINKNRLRNLYSQSILFKFDIICLEISYNKDNLYIIMLNVLKFIYILINILINILCLIHQKPVITSLVFPNETFLYFLIIYMQIHLVYLPN